MSVWLLLTGLFSFSRHRCRFATFKQCQEWAKRLNRAIAPPSRLEDLFALAYHAWCLGGSADDEDQHLHLCRPGNMCNTHDGFRSVGGPLASRTSSHSSCHRSSCAHMWSYSVCTQVTMSVRGWNWRSRGWASTHRTSGGCRILTLTTSMSHARL